MSTTLVPQDLPIGAETGVTVTRTSIGMIPVYQFRNDGRVVLMLKNTGGEAGPIVVRPQRNIHRARDMQHKTITVPATTGDVIAGPFPVAEYNDPDGYATFSPNLIDRGDCEETTGPCVYGEDDPYENNATFARDDGQADEGTYSYLFTKTSSAGTGAYIRFHSDIDVVNMRGLVAGNAYTLRLRMYIPSGAMLAAEVDLRISEYTSGWDATSENPAANYDAWQTVEVTKTISAAATGVNFMILIDNAAAVNETFYIDQVGLHPASTESDSMTAALIRRSN